MFGETERACPIALEGSRTRPQLKHAAQVGRRPIRPRLLFCLINRCQEIHMGSITHAPGQNASTRKIRRTSRSSSESVSDQIRGFYYDARRAALGHDYLRRKWLPREGPLFYAFIQVMRSFCYYNPHTGELREECYPKVDTIAERCGVNPAT